MTGAFLLPPVLRLHNAARSITGRYRSLIIGVALLALSILGIWSASRIGLEWRTIGWRWLGAAAVTVPIAMVANAAELALCSRATAGALPLRSAFIYSAGATLLNVLPIPGGMVLRAQALASNGVGWVESGVVIAAAGFLWLAMAVACIGVALMPATEGMATLAAGVATSAVVAGWVARRAGGGVAVGFVLVRAALIALLVIRLSFCFQAIAQPVGVQDSAIFVVAGVVSSGVAIVPAGVGITEGIGAAMAGLVGASSAAAFVALALNRLLGLSGSFIAVAAHLLARRLVVVFPYSASTGAG